MQRDDDVGGSPSGHDTDIGGSHSGGDAGDKPHKAFGEESREGSPDVSAKEAQHSDAADYDETPDDLELGKRRTGGED